MVTSMSPFAYLLSGNACVRAYMHASAIMRAWGRVCTCVRTWRGMYLVH